MLRSTSIRLFNGFHSNGRIVIGGLILASMISISSATTTPNSIKYYKYGWFDMTAKIPSFGKTALAKFATKDLHDSAEKRLKEFRKDIFDQKEKPFCPVNVEWTTETSINSPDLISLSALSYYNFGGAHPGADTKTFNYALMNGKVTKVGLGNFMKTRIMPEALATQLIIPKLKARGCSFVVDGSVTSLTREQADNFVITKSGLAWIFSQYDVASWAEGVVIVKLTWAELQPHLNAIGPLERLMSKEHARNVLLDDLDRIAALKSYLIPLT